MEILSLICGGWIWVILKSAQNSPFRDIFLSDIKAIINYKYDCFVLFCCLYSEQIQFEYKAMKKILAISGF